MGAILHLIYERVYMNVYLENGFKNRQEYLENLADDFDTDKSTVFMLAEFLGQSEDFDGLITSLEDYLQDY